MSEDLTEIGKLVGSQLIGKATSGWRSLAKPEPHTIIAFGGGGAGGGYGDTRERQQIYELRDRLAWQEQTLARYCETIDKLTAESALAERLRAAYLHDQAQMTVEIERLTAERDAARAFVDNARTYQVLCDATDPGPALVAETAREFTRTALPDVEQPKPGTETEKRVNDVIDDLTARKVGDIDRFRLRGALDKADKPLEGREGADAGLGRAISRSTREPFSIGW